MENRSDYPAAASYAATGLPVLENNLVAHIHQLLYTNTDALSAHGQRVVGKTADDAVGIRVLLGAARSTFPAILRVWRSFHCPIQ